MVTIHTWTPSLCRPMDHYVPVVAETVKPCSGTSTTANICTLSMAVMWSTLCVSHRTDTGCVQVRERSERKTSSVVDFFLFQQLENPSKSGTWKRKQWLMNSNPTRNAHHWLGQLMVKRCLLVSPTNKFESSKFDHAKPMTRITRKEDKYLPSTMNILQTIVFVFFDRLSFIFLLLLMLAETKRRIWKKEEKNHWHHSRSIPRVPCSTRKPCIRHKSNSLCPFFGKKKRVYRCLPLTCTNIVFFVRRRGKKNIMPRAGIELALSGPQPDVLPLYYRGESTWRVQEFWSKHRFIDLTFEWGYWTKKDEFQFVIESQCVWGLFGSEKCWTFPVWMNSIHDHTASQSAFWLIIWS